MKKPSRYEFTFYDNGVRTVVVMEPMAPLDADVPVGRFITMQVVEKRRETVERLA